MEQTLTFMKGRLLWGIHGDGFWVRSDEEVVGVSGVSQSLLGGNSGRRI